MLQPAGEPRAAQSTSNHDSFLYPVPIFTVVSNGMIATFTSPSFFAAFLRVSSSEWAAVFRLLILPDDAIDPVLSSTSASSSRLIPHTTSDFASMAIWYCPSRRVNVVGTAPLAASSILKLPASGLLYVGTSVTLVTSGRLNCAAK